MTESKININRKMKYINDFEIIDTQILFDLSFFNSKINNKSIQSRFYQFNDKILIIFKDNTLFNFQIGYFKNDEFIVEYLIDLQANLDKQNGFLNLENLFKKVNIDGLLNYIYHNNDVNNFQIDDAILYFYNMPKNIFNNSIDLSYLNSTTNIIINNSIQKQKDDKIKIDKSKYYIQILIEFYKSQNEIINNCSNSEKTFYLVSDRWINEFKSIFYYDKILPNQIKDLISKNECNLLNKIYDILDDNIKNYLNNLDASEISNLIINKDLLDLGLGKYDQNTCQEISYFHKCCIIYKDAFDCLEKINIKIIQDLYLENYNCFFWNGKIFINFGKQELIIGHYENDLFITEKIIYSNPDNIDIIKELLKIYGYNFIKYFIFEGEEIEIENNIKIIKLLKKIEQDFYTTLIITYNSLY